MNAQKETSVSSDTNHRSSRKTTRTQVTSVPITEYTRTSGEGSEVSA